MREIKFRAWDKGDRKMKSVLILQIGFGATSYDYADDNVAVGTDDSNRVLMQYTGVKDKNGKEIYEGDIVALYQFDKKTGKYYHNKGNRVVEWVKSSNGWNFKRIGTRKNVPIEVIGNIYENPELIKKNPARN